MDGPRVGKFFVCQLAVWDAASLRLVSVGDAGNGRSSVAAEPARRIDCLEFAEVEIADHLQRIGQRAALQVGR